MPASTRASIRAAVEVARMPLSIASVRTPCTIGKVPSLLDVDLVRTGADGGHDGAEHAQVRGREGLDQVCEPRQKSALAAHELEQGLLGPREEVGRARHGGRVEEDGDVHRRLGIAAQHPGLELADEAVEGCDQTGLRTMTFPGRAGNPNPSSAPENASRKRARSAAAPRRPEECALSWSVRTVCSPRPSDPMSSRQPLPDRGGRDHLEQLA